MWSWTMGWDDKLSEAKEASTEKVTRAKENTSSKIEDKVDSVSESIPDRGDAKNLAERTKREAALEYRYAKTGLRHPVSRCQVLLNRTRDDPLRTIKGLVLLDAQVREEIVEETVDVSNGEARFWATISYEQFAEKGTQLRQPILYFGGEALKISREVDFGQTYRYGKYGAKAGADYGRYIPVVGDFGPHVGFTFGAAMGAATSIDLIDAERIKETTEPASAAAEELAQTEGDPLRTKMLRGGVAYAESSFGRATDPTLDELIEMDYRDFAN